MSHFAGDTAPTTRLNGYLTKSDFLLEQHQNKKPANSLSNRVELVAGVGFEPTQSARGLRARAQPSD